LLAIIVVGTRAQQQELRKCNSAPPFSENARAAPQKRTILHYGAMATFAIRAKKNSSKEIVRRNELTGILNPGFSGDAATPRFRHHNPARQRLFDDHNLGNSCRRFRTLRRRHRSAANDRQALVATHRDSAFIVPIATLR
jgi:hypothetical protein